MLLHIPAVLSSDQVQHARNRLMQADWSDGKITAGYQSSRAKNNLQLDEASEIATELRQMILTALSKNPVFFSAALPQTIFPPLFNRYIEGQSFGFHVDNAIRYDRTQGNATAVRTDLSATVFLNDPDDYDGGELIIEDTYGMQQVKLPAGDMILYPGTSLHQVTPITRGERLASFLWIQSMIRDDAQRRTLFELDIAIQQLTQTNADHPSLLKLTNVYHNLLRQWANV